MRLDLGCAVNCKDAVLGELADIVIDPTTRRVTHLVVEPHHGLYTRRLVPIGLVREGDEAPLVLECSIGEAASLEHAEETVYLRLGEAPVEDPKWDITATEMLALPYYEAMDMPGVTPGIDYAQGVNVRYDRVPKGEVEIRRSSAVTSADGHHLGHVDGFVVDGEQNVAALVLEHGHLWGKREVSIPIGAVERVDGDAVVLTLSKEDVGRLEPVRVHRWRGHGG